MFKPFFVHRHHRDPNFLKRYKRPRGFTLYVQPKLDDYKMCIISGTWCSNADNFCRKIGRDNAIKAEQHVINKRDLPKWVSRMATECGMGGEYDEYLYKYLF